MSLMVNETKLISRNAFVLDLFALGGEKQSKHNERTPLWRSIQKLHSTVDPSPPKDAYTRFSGLFLF